MTKDKIIVLTEREQWLIDWLKSENPLYIESGTLIKEFHKKFFEKNKEQDKYGFWHMIKTDETRKEIQKNLRKLSKNKLIEKKAMGVYDWQNTCLGKNWVWGWRLKTI